MPTGAARERSISTTPIPVRKGSLLVVLSWGSVARYLYVRPAMTVGELREYIARKIGRLFDRAVVGLKLLVTGSDVAPELNSPLTTLTHAGCRNVCLDVTTAPRTPTASYAASIGEHLLRKHLNNEPFQVGVDQGLWRLIHLRWPHAVFGIMSVADDKRCELGVRLNFEKYPLAPPLVELWNVEARVAIGADHWPESFSRFATENYPNFADLTPQPYSPELLRISTEVAARQKKGPSETWDSNGDLTQVLARASCSFRSSQFPLPSAVPQEISLQPNRSAPITAPAPKKKSPVFHRQRSRFSLN